MKVAIVGSHGIYADYGGFEQLVTNLAERKDESVEYLIFNSRKARQGPVLPEGVRVKRMPLSASGFQGLFYDFFSILYCYFSVDTILLLGIQGIPAIPILRIFRGVRVVSNVGGIEWERPHFNIIARLYFRLCFRLAQRFSETLIFDNKVFLSHIDSNTVKAEILVIPYGGVIDTSLSADEEMVAKYPFLKQNYFLSVSRSLMDNKLHELCQCFAGTDRILVLISNFTSSDYGKRVWKEYSDFPNIILINGLYIKEELDLIRRHCQGYIHTHTLCGTAPSLVEMIISGRPILSIDVPQNRFTLDNNYFFFRSFEELRELLLSDSSFSEFIPPDYLLRNYQWESIVARYESCYA